MRGLSRSTLLAVLVLVMAAAAAMAQTTPVVQVEYDENRTIPGQFLTLRITVLVPTWMPKPIAFPPLDAPNIRVRLPDQATAPTSKRINGDEWSGVTRRYLVSPMAPGRFSLPEGAIEVSYADPDDTSQVIKANLVLPALEVEGLVPEGAEDLMPFIAAKGLTLEQAVSDPVTDLKPGDSIRRTVTANISGASPMMLPQLMEPPQIVGFTTYEDEPVLAESEDRGVISGSRTETQTFMVQGNGNGTLPGIELRWYNIASQTVETTSLDPVEVSATGATVTARDLVLRDNPAVWLLGSAGLIVLAIVVWAAGPVLVRAVRTHQERFRASKAYARKTVLKAIAAHDYPATVAALQTWVERPPETSRTDRQDVRDALRAISAQRYGGAGLESTARDWQTLAESIRRAGHHTAEADHGALPALNP